MGATEMFSEVLPPLAKNRQVIAIDLQAHGRTADIERPLRYEAMADDIAALIHYLKIEKAGVMGYSDGGRSRPTHRDPASRRGQEAGARFNHLSRDRWYPAIVAGMTQMRAGSAAPMKQTPMYQLYARIAPRPEDWRVLLTKLGDLFRKDYDWSKHVPASAQEINGGA